MAPCRLLQFPQLDYFGAEELQSQLVASRKGGQIPDHLLVLEHPPVLTLGRGGDIAHLKVSPQWLEQRGVPLVRTGRGGEITYHGPQQLVAYPILLLQEGRRDLHRYLRDLEQTVMDTLADFSVTGQRVPGKTGVWVEERKIASIGIRTSSWVTSHGVALNYGEDLGGFDWITPCGLEGVEMTSLAREGAPVGRVELEKRFCLHFQRIFGRELV